MAAHLPPHVQSYTVALSPAQAQQLMSQLQGTVSHGTLHALANAIQPTGGVQVQPAANKKKRSLNCFVAFRCK